MRKEKMTPAPVPHENPIMTQRRKRAKWAPLNIVLIIWPGESSIDESEISALQTAQSYVLQSWFHVYERNNFDEICLDKNGGSVRLVHGTNRYGQWNRLSLERLNSSPN